VPVDPKNLPEDPAILKQMLVDLTQQLDKTNRLLRQLVASKGGTRSEQLSADQLRLFAKELGAELSTATEEDQHDSNDDPPSPAGTQDGESKPRGRRQLPSHLKRERLVHDLAEEEKHCARCDAGLRHIGEEISERYEYIPAQMLVIEDACQKYACACTVRTAGKPASAD
jgi:transposase